MRGPRGGIVALVMIATIAGGAAGCSSGADSADTKSSGTVARPQTGPPSPPGALVCSRTIQRQIAASIGMPAATVTGPTHVGGQVSCRYRYPGATMTISLDQADERGAETRFADLARRLGARPEPPLLGDEAFISTDGSTLVVRGGSRVLEVDLSGSPTELGQPPQPRALVARAVAGTIVGCDDPPCPKGALRFEDEGDE